MELLIEKTVSKKNVQEIVETQLKFYFPEITAINFDKEKIIIEYSGSVDEQVIGKQVDIIIDKFKTLPNIPQKVFYSSEKNTIKELDISSNDIKHFNQAAEKFLEILLSFSNNNKDLNKTYLKDPVLKVRKGLNIYQADTALIFHALDVFFREYYSLKFGANELKVPSMISSEVVDQAGYFETGCQHISFVSPISNEPDKYEEFLPAWKNRDITSSIHEYLKKPKDVLNPALCLHCYPLLENQVVPHGQFVSFTVSGSCFRDESGNLNNDERLNEFTMREAVFVGDPEILKSIRTKLEEFTILLGVWLGFKFRLEAATDIFFDENAQLQLFSQLASNNKIEFSVYSSKINKYMASGSINSHQNHFSKRFEIKDQKLNYTNSMCIGFGFNRLLLVISEKLEKGLPLFIEDLQENLMTINSLLDEELVK
ncbi:hypothetical protein PDN43_23495 [Bacillus cereus]|nr:hypothetical protein [Bacillus cereus]MDA2307635.1 hypothetical protein [Bacillus cereus]